MERKSTAGGRGQNGERLPALLICSHIAICCVCLFYVADNDPPVAFDPVVFHWFSNQSWLHIVVAALAACTLISAIFSFARFGFAYPVRHTALDIPRR